MTPATILVADDDAPIRRLIATSLRAAGHTVLEAATADEALGQAREAPDLLIADLVMPSLGGLELATMLRSKLPRLAVLHMSGYQPRTDFNSDASATLLSKPFTLAELHAHVDWLLAAHRADFSNFST
jgi:CheY-like chemotaxis protein